MPEPVPTPAANVRSPMQLARPLAPPAAPIETLDQAWQLAIQSSSALASKGHLVAAGTSAARAASAARYPDLSVGAGYTVRDREPAYRVPPSVVLPGFNSLPTAERDAFGFQTTVELPVYTSGRIGHEIAAAGNQRRAAELNYQTAIANLKLRVAQAYIAVLREQHVLRVATERESNLRAHLSDTENLLANDQVPQNDLLAAEVALANASQQVLQAQNRLAMHRAEYNRLLERDLDVPINLSPLAVPPELPSLDTFCLAAGQGRTELAQLGAQSRARSAGRRRAGLHQAAIRTPRTIRIRAEPVSFPGRDCGTSIWCGMECVGWCPIAARGAGHQSSSGQLSPGDGRHAIGNRAGDSPCVALCQ